MTFENSLPCRIVETGNGWPAVGDKVEADGTVYVVDSIDSYILKTCDGVDSYIHATIVVADNHNEWQIVSCRVDTDKETVG